MTKIITRLLSKTIDDAGCMVWQGACCNDHPAFRIGKKTLLVRRYIWEQTHGRGIPAGHVVHVTCDTPRCVSLMNQPSWDPPKNVYVRNNGNAQYPSRGIA